MSATTALAAGTFATSAASTLGGFLGQSQQAAAQQAQYDRSVAQAQAEAAATAKEKAMTARYNAAIARRDAGLDKYNAVAIENDAKVQRQDATVNAAEALDAANVDAEEIRREGGRTQGTVEANAGASGIVSDGGSPYEVLMENAQNIELAAQRRLFTGKSEARRYTVSGARAASRLDNEAVLAHAQEDLDLHKADLEIWRGNTPTQPRPVGAAYTPGASYLQAGAGLLESGFKAWRVLGGKNPFGGIFSGGTPSGGDGPFGGPTADRPD